VVNSKDLCVILVVQHDTIISVAALWYEPAEQNLFHLNCDMHLLMVHGASRLDVCCNYVWRLWPGCREQHASKDESSEIPVHLQISSANPFEVIQVSLCSNTPIIMNNVYSTKIIPSIPCRRRVVPLQSLQEYPQFGC